MQLLNIVAIIIFLLRQILFIITEKSADTEKPKTRFFSRHNFGRYFAYGVEIFIILQLIGISIFPMPSDIFNQIIGLVFVITGFLITIIARLELGNNWAHASEYQIKQDQELITKGIYKYIRHPIYLGLILLNTGGELVAGSYLWVIFILFFSVVFYLHSKKEEDILQAHFGEAYKNYQKNSKMFIPYVL